MEDRYYDPHLVRINPPPRSELRQALDANKGSVREAIDAASANPMERLTQQTLSYLDPPSYFDPQIMRARRHAEPEPEHVTPGPGPGTEQTERPKRVLGLSPTMWRWLGGLLTLVLATVIANLLTGVL
jgi:hypothetical protein